ncbi:MAG: hypothetical protein ACRENS_01935 [Candidatus Eiseniibacteriota bacterium]
MPDGNLSGDAATRAAATMRRAIRVFQFLLESQSEFFISERALDFLLNEFSARLEREILRGNSDQLLDAWEKRLSLVRPHLLREVTQRPLRFSDGTQAAVLTLDVARRFVGVCPDANEEAGA